jgi:hypothetical protein
VTHDELLSDLGIPSRGGRRVGPMWAFPAEAADLVPWWQRLRSAHDRSGLWPFLIGPDLDRLAESVEAGGADDAAAEIERGLTMDVDARLAELRAEALSWNEGEDDELPPRGEVENPEAHDGDSFYLAEGRGWIGLVEATAGHLVPGLLGWGGAVNYDIEPALHVALLKQWHERFGAELVGCSLDVLELRVPRPPSDPAEVLAVAEQQYWYCPDVVDQGVGTLDALAVVQVPTHRWFFWWD